MRAKPLFAAESPRGRTARQRLAAIRRQSSTRAERALEAALRRYDHGYFHRKFQREWVMGRRWRLDFFFWEARIGVELDGAYHAAPQRRALDRRKRFACRQFDIELLRFTNEDVLNDAESVIRAIGNAHDARLRCRK